MAITHIRNYKAVLGLSLIGMFVSACASTGVANIKTKTQSNLKSGLPAQTLAVGECGLFVWAARPSKPFILFSKAAELRGLWHEGVQESLTLITQSGEIAYGQSPENIYLRPNGERLRLALSDPEMIEDGMRYKSGTLTLQTPEGWEKIIPVIGLAACQIKA